MKKTIVAVLFAALVFSIFPALFGETIYVPKKLLDAGIIPLGTTPSAAETAAALALKVDVTDGVATNLTVPTLVFTAVDSGTNYIATLVWDATNNVFTVTETAQ